MRQNDVGQHDTLARFHPPEKKNRALQEKNMVVYCISLTGVETKKRYLNNTLE